MPEQATAAPPAQDKPTVAAPDKPTSDSPPVQNMDDVYGEFDAIEGRENTSEAPKREVARQTPKPAQDAGEKSQKDNTSSNTSSDSDQKKTPASTGTSDAGNSTEPKPVKAAELRNAYENLKREHSKLKSEHETLRTRSADTTRVKQLEEMLDAERKAKSELENELKFTAYEKSQEFKDKFQKPYMQAYALGRQKAASLKVVEQKDDIGETVRPARQGTEADFDSIMRIDDDDAAAERAVELFGPKAQMVLYYRERVQELHQSSRAAIEDYRKNAETREKEQSEAKTRQEQEQSERARVAAETFKKLVDDGVKAHPELFNPQDGDAEASEIVKRGQAVADSLFSGVNPKTGQPYTQDGLIKFHAFVRNAVAAHGHILHQLKSAKTRITELESDLAEFKKSSSSSDSGRSEAKAQSGLAGDDEFDAAEARGGKYW